MNAPIAVSKNGHRTWLKWHRGRRRAADPVFTAQRILEAMQLGASVEVDLVVHGEHGFAVLHDHLSIARETTGQGNVRSYTAAQLRALHLRGNDGAPVADHVMLLEDLCLLLKETPPHPTALLQLDYKEDAAALDPLTVTTFAASTAPVARNLILSSGDASAVAQLSRNVPGMRIGYDPCSDKAIDSLRQSRDFAGFVNDTLAASPAAEVIYLSWPLVIELDKTGFDIIAAFHAAGKRVDAWTIRRADEVSRQIVERLIALQVDQITTDDPEGLHALIGEGQ